ncbi:MAG: preprotein translocase subunit YajC [Myxococcales bacterium]|nr:preprotein translocase subunit YajC [Myxococcales bacterium]
MLFSILEFLWWFQPEATGMGGGGAEPAGGGGGALPGCGGGGGTLPMMLIMVAVVYFMMIRPQTKQRKELEAMLKALKKGDIVRTQGGIRGEITDLNDREVTLLVAEKTRINVLRGAVQGLDIAPSTTDKEKEGKG